MTASHSYRLGLLLVTGSAVAWSTAGLFTRLIPLDVWTLLLWRGLFGALGVLLYIVLRDGRRGLASFADLGVAGWAFVVVGTIGMLCFITALRLTSVAHASIIYATVPLLAAALAWVVMREKPSASAMIASVVALAGVAVMVGLGADGSLAGDPRTLAAVPAQGGAQVGRPSGRRCTHRANHPRGHLGVLRISVPA